MLGINGPEAYQAVGHKGHMTPLNIPLIFEIVSAPDEKSFHGGHRGQTPKIVSLKLW